MGGYKREGGDQGGEHGVYRRKEVGGEKKGEGIRGGGGYGCGGGGVDGIWVRGVRGARWRTSSGEGRRGEGG